MDREKFGRLVLALHIPAALTPLFRKVLTP